ncbi:hypothetical protein BH23BAC3_BH23BAC3_22360 [soil metagenome]
MGFKNNIILANPTEADSDSDSKTESGYALATVLILLSLILVIIGFIIMMTISHNRFIQKDIHQVKARYYAEAGINTFLSDPEYFRDSTRTSFELYLPDSVRVLIDRQQFGGFWRVKSTAMSSNQTKKIQVLIGATADTLYDNAIVMGDVNSALILTGKTSIQGVIISGTNGIQQRSFRGDPFTGTISGDNVRTDSTVFPAFNSQAIEQQLQNVTEPAISAPENATQLNTVQFNLQRYPESDSTYTFYANGNLTLDSRQQIRLYDETTFFVNGSLEIRDNINLGEYSRFFVRDSVLIDGNVSGHQALIIAGKKIQVEGSPVFSSQLISGQQVIIRGDSYLRYPSLVYVQSSVENGTKKGTISLQETSVVDGYILLPDVSELITNDQSLVTIGEQALLRGGLYNTSKTELNGKVEGTVLTYQFYFYHSPTDYLNWLKDSEVDRRARPSSFTIPLGFSEQPNFMILDYKERPADDT